AASCRVSGDLCNPEDYFECPKGFEEAHKKRSWSKKLTLIKKLKASKDYLKSLFASSGHRRSSNNKPSTTSSSSPSSSSSSSDSSSSSFSRVVLRRSSSVSSDKEGSVQAAIAYCKKSQQRVCGRKSVSDVEFLFGARI
ncbi:probable membrane-associated kinase regulator 4, partial [Asparagus officinalis]|uniref:probable membrane-associated kinase regulator 4 n=1 Tax=Asparagus officinalis TaxID=4686 RepID=UPI00098E04E0